MAKSKQKESSDAYTVIILKKLRVKSIKWENELFYIVNGESTKKREHS